MMRLGEFIKLLQQCAASVTNIAGGFLGIVYVGTAASAPAASSNSGKFAIFTETGWLFRSNGTIWDRVGGGPVAIDTYANIIATYAAASYSGCTARATDIGLNGHDLISNGTSWRLKNRSGDAINIYAAPFSMSNAYILFGGGSATWSRDANGLLTVTKTSHVLSADFDGATMHMTQGTLLTGSTNITTGWGYTDFTYVDPNTFTVQTTVLEEGTGSCGSNTSKTYIPWTYTYPANLIQANDAVSLGLVWRRCSNSANTKTMTTDYSGYQVGSSARTTAGTNWLAESTAACQFTSASNKFIVSTLTSTEQTDTTRTFAVASTLANATDWDFMMPMITTYTSRSPV